MALFGGGAGIVGGATVRLLLDDSKFRAGLATAEGETKAASSTMGKFGAGAKAAFAVGGIAAVSFGASSVKAFMESETVAAEFNNTLSKMPKLAGETIAPFQEQATALQNLTGFEDEAIISADNLLARFNLTAEQIRQAIPIVLDYARATGKDVPAAAQDIGKALLGNTRALKNVGIEFTVTGNKGKDFNSILDLMEGKVGGTAEAFGTTLAGKMEIAKARMNDLQEGFGQFIAQLADAAVKVASFGGLLDKLAADLNEQTTTAIERGGAALEAYTWKVKAAQETSGGWLGDILGAFVPGFRAGTIEIDKQSTALDEAAGWYDLDASAIGSLTVAQSAARTEMQHTTSAIEAEAAAHGKAADAANQQRLAELGLAGGLIGLESDVVAVKNAQAALRSSTGDHTAKVIALQSAITTLAGDMDAYNKKQGATVGGSQAAIGSLIGLGRQFGLTKQDVIGAADSALRYSDILNNIPPKVETVVVTRYETIGSPPAGSPAAGRQGQIAT